MMSSRLHVVVNIERDLVVDFYFRYCHGICRGFLLYSMKQKRVIGENVLVMDTISP